jgi:hypothetical protein
VGFGSCPPIPDLAENSMDASVKSDSTTGKVERRAATPVAGAIAGILFAVLFGVSVTILITTMTELSKDTGAWL